MQTNVGPNVMDTINHKHAHETKMALPLLPVLLFGK